MYQSGIYNIFISKSWNSFSGNCKTIHFHYEAALQQGLRTHVENKKTFISADCWGKINSYDKDLGMLQLQYDASLYCDVDPSVAQNRPQRQKGFIPVFKSVVVFRYPKAFSLFIVSTSKSSKEPSLTLNRFCPRLSILRPFLEAILLVAGVKGNTALWYSDLTVRLKKWWDQRDYSSKIKKKFNSLCSFCCKGMKCYFLWNSNNRCGIYLHLLKSGSWKQMQI